MKLVCKTQIVSWSNIKTSEYYIVPSLINETPDRIILHGGYNDVNNKNSTPEKIENGDTMS